MCEVPIEQAIFTSVRRSTREGYHVAATSPGVDHDEIRELSIWGPAHDALLDPRQGAQSINFHQLSSGRFCVSLTTALDAEYSGRGGCEVYTQSLLVAPETLRRFANDPFRLLDAARAAKQLTPLRPVPETLPSFSLVGKASAVNSLLLTRLMQTPGVGALIRLLEVALTAPALALAHTLPAARLFAGLLNLLPVECRPAFSFTTGLHPSSRRPFRWCVVGNDAGDRREVAARSAAFWPPQGEVSATGGEETGWAGYIGRLLRENGVTGISAVLKEPRPDVTCEQLDELALELASSTRPRAVAIN